MKKYLILIAISMTICCSASVDILEPSSKKESASEKKYNKISASEFILSNGMRVCLKPTSFEEDEISIMLFANGGFSLLNPTKRAAAELSTEIFLESGFAGFTRDKLSVLMYQTATDFKIKVGAFTRSLEAVSSFDNIDVALKLINLSFTKPNFNDIACKTVVERVKQLIKKRAKDPENTFEANYIAINTGNCAALRQLSLADLEHFDCKVSEKFFEEAFSNPAEFTCVIVGDFEEEKLKLKLEKYLETIPSRALLKTESNYTAIARFPEGIILKQIQQDGIIDSFVHLTFPVKMKLDQKNISSVEVACKVIEDKLRQKIKASCQGVYGVDVAYAFPLYPSLDPSWITIEFSVSPASVDKMTRLILAELTLLQAEKIPSFNLENRKDDEYWLRQNDFWLVNLSNYYLVGWNRDQIIKDIEREKKLSSETIHDVIKSIISLTNYTIIWSVP